MKQETSLENTFECEGLEYVVEWGCELDENCVLSINLVRIEAMDGGSVDAEVLETAVEIVEAAADLLQEDYAVQQEAIAKLVSDYWLP